MGQSHHSESQGQLKVRVSKGQGLRILNATEKVLYEWLRMSMVWTKSVEVLEKNMDQR